MAGNSGNALDDPELRRFLEEQSQVAQFTQQALFYVDLCWDKCVKSPGSKSIGGGNDTKTETCLVNCVDRFMETTMFMLQRLQSKGGAGRP
eukprot:m.34919 g.34919  ORF g.34919 m.34919 type:complete len:91 (+) comp11217_c0_seq1:137-409(+)